MNDLVLLAGNSLIGLLFLGLWLADKKQRGYFAWWGIAEICLGFAAMLALIMSIQKNLGVDTNAWRITIIPLAAVPVSSPTAM